MYSFMDDYSEGCHPQILDALVATNLTQQAAYGDDAFSEQARDLICAAIGTRVPIHFVAGGTLANLTIAAAILRPHEAVITATSGHMASHEAGAVEATGHKLIGVPPENGKLTPEGIQKALDANAFFPHMARPRLVYISNASETGTVYSRPELDALACLCRDKSLYLMMDGARLGTALASPGSDMTLADIAALTDVFWIGGTKAGTLMGEAIVLPNSILAEDFAFHVKQRGAMLAKGRLLGLQFRELFRDDLFSRGARHANDMAARLARGISAAGFRLSAPVESNQVFPELPNTLISSLQASFSFHQWQATDADHSIVRLVTSWATGQSQVDAFLQAVNTPG